jgi:hypothetical protein
VSAVPEGKAAVAGRSSALRLLFSSTHAIPPNPAPKARNVKSTPTSAQSPCAIVAAKCLSVMSAFNTSFCKTLPQAVAEFWSRTLEARFPVFRVFDGMLPGYFLL